MPSEIVRINPTGRINRRAITTELPSDQVLKRENFYVTGQKPYLKVKKFAGSDRYNSNSVGSLPVVWASRYYTKANKRKNFFFSGGTLYHIDDLGNTSSLITTFSPTAYPVSVEMRVSDVDILYFMEGVNTGMYSHDGNDSNVFTKETAVTLNPVGAVSWLDRMWVFEEDSEDLYFSKNLEPTNFTDSTDAGIITIGAKRGSKIQQIVVYKETLFIFKTDSIWAIQGKTPSEFSVVEVHPTMGLAARRSLVATSSVLMGYMSDYEVYSFAGTQESMKLLTYDIGLSGGLVNTNENLLPIVNTDRLEQICATYHNFLYRMSFTESGQTQNKMEYIFNTINETDAFTRGNNVSCYLVYDRQPDHKELVTGRSDAGYLMHQYRGLNYDNQATGANMRLLHQTSFYGLEGPRNFRIRRYWGNFGVLGAYPLPIRMLTDARTALSDSTSDQLDTQGETKTVAGLRIQSQSAVTSRQIPRHGNAKCQSFSLLIDETLSGFDTEFSSFDIEIIGKNLKRNRKVAA
jgi:hypothetical protein